MSYTTIRAGQALAAALRSRGFDPDYTTLGVKELAQYEDVINHAMRTAWERARWPQVMVTERRQYRPTWAAGVICNEGNQVYYDGGYWESLVDGNVGNVPVEGDYWTALEPGDMVLCLPFVQPWADDAGYAVQAMEAPGVDLAAFAYDLDPLLSPRAHAVAGCRFWQDTVVLPADGSAPLRPYVRFRPESPTVSYTTWAAGTAYAAGDRVYVAADGESYLALLPSTGATPSASPTYWRAVGIPKMFADYIRLRCKAEFAADDEGKWKSAGEAEAELDRVESAYMTGTQADERATVRMPRRGRGGG
jgi:hypothetical protein